MGPKEKKVRTCTEVFKFVQNNVKRQIRTVIRNNINMMLYIFNNTSYVISIFICDVYFSDQH